MKSKRFVYVLFTVCILLTLTGCAAPKCAYNSATCCLNDADPDCEIGLCDECCRDIKKADDGIQLGEIYTCNVDH